MAAFLHCSACAAEFPPEVLGVEEARCPDCARPVKVLVFPAFLKAPGAGTFGERVVVDGESACFYHSEKKATVICDGCGRFLCGLCDIELAGQHICSPCLEAGRSGTAAKIESKRPLHERTALGVAVAGLLLGPFGVATSLIAVYVSLRYWKEPEQLGTWRKVRKIAAIVLSLAILGFWGATLIWLLS